MDDLAEVGITPQNNKEIEDTNVSNETVTDTSVAPDNQEDVVPSYSESAETETSIETTQANDDTFQEAPEYEWATTQTITIAISFLDLAGLPIEGLKYKVTIGETPYLGVTDKNGASTLINQISPNQLLSIEIKKDDGSYALKFQGMTSYSDMNITAVSPYIKIPITTEKHLGTPVKPQEPTPEPKPVAKTIYPQAGEIKKAKETKKINVVQTRDIQGHPVLTVKDKLLDWAGRHQIPTLGLWHWKDFNQKNRFQPAQAVTPKQIAVNNNKIFKKVVSGKDAGPLKINNTQQQAPQKLTNLINIMEEQCTWQWKAMMEGPPRLSSANILNGLKNNTLEPPKGKDISKTNGRCYASVKVGLTRAEITQHPWGDIPAKGAGLWLKNEGFTEITANIPDARWAMPGDVIVYRYPDEKEAANIAKHEKQIKKYQIDLENYNLAKASYPEKKQAWEQAKELHNKEQAELKKQNPKHKYHPFTTKAPKQPIPPKPVDDGNNGHIEVRSYDGYLSDYKSLRLAKAVSFVVIGIYRKVYDPLPDLRVRAFLEIIASKETNGIPLEKSWYVLNEEINSSKYATSLDKHPWLGLPFTDAIKKGIKSTAAGRYQLTLTAWKEAIEKYSGPEDFSPTAQSRLAVIRMEYRQALGLIRQGKIQEAVPKLKDEWVVLKSYPINQLLIDYQSIMEKLKNEI